MNIFNTLVLPIAAAFLIALLGKVLGFYIEAPSKSSIRIIARRVESAALILAAAIITLTVSIHVITANTPPKSLSDSPPPAPSGTLICVPGNISIDGSTALAPLVKAVAKDYEAKCPKATIKVDQSSSSTGLYNVESGKIDIANSDISALPTQGDLIEHRVAVVIFTIVINPNLTGVNTLTTEQLRGIYNGTISNWNQVGGPNLPITVFTRIPSSGTRTTLDNYILCGSETPNPARTQQANTTDEVAAGVQQTPGAIGYVDLGAALSFHLNFVYIDGHAPLPDQVKQNSYKFWNLERMYTKGLPAPGSLSNAFIQYMTNTPAEELIANTLSYLNFNAMANAGLSTHVSCK